MSTSFGLLGTLGTGIVSWLGTGFGGVAVLIFYVGFLALYCAAIRYLVDIMAMKGYEMKKRWPFYLIGFFCSPVVLGLMACAIPDRSQ